MKVYRGNPDGFKRLEQVFLGGVRDGIKTELMTSLVFFPRESWKTRFLERIRKTVDITRAACGMEAGQCVLATGRRTETGDKVEKGQGRPGLGGWDLCD